MSSTEEARPKTARSARVSVPAKTPVNGEATLHPHELLAALQAMRVGDFSVRMAGDRLGIEGKIADTFNEIVAANQRMA